MKDPDVIFAVLIQDNQTPFTFKEIEDEECNSVGLFSVVRVRSSAGREGL